MVNTISGLKNVNLLTKEQYDGVAEPTNEELWAVEIETYSDDDGNWYRIYPDGWCEQGGTVGTTTTSGYPKYTINLLKAMKDGNFNVQVTGRYTSNSNDGTNYCYDRTTTSISVVSVGNGSDWFVCGYIA